jgi:hypothetical protein
MKANPLKKALQFLRWFCREDYHEEIEGDLMMFCKSFRRGFLAGLQIPTNTLIAFTSVIS